jgi:hypothetical protein
MPVQLNPDFIAGPNDPPLGAFFDGLSCFWPHFSQHRQDAACSEVLAGISQIVWLKVNHFFLVPSNFYFISLFVYLQLYKKRRRSRVSKCHIEIIKKTVTKRLVYLQLNKKKATKPMSFFFLHPFGGA